MENECLPRTELKPGDWLWTDKTDPPYHRKHYTANLMKYHDLLMGAIKPSRVFVPLCGKTMDMIYLVEQGHEVVGLEFSEIAISNFFAENNLTYSEENVDKKPLMKYTAKEQKITIYRGDLFDLTSDVCGTFDAAWDRGSFVAINVPTRGKYAKLMSSLIKPSGKILMEIMKYDSSKYNGPPHFTTEHHLEENFKDFNVEILSQFEIMNPQPSYYSRNDMQLAIALLTHV